MSETEEPTSNGTVGESDVHPDFQSTPETDLVLRSTDKTHFYIEKNRLKYYCADGFPAASEISASFVQVPVEGARIPDMVDMTDANAESLALLLKCMFPENQPDLSAANFETVLGALGEAFRYQIPAVLNLLINRARRVA
jgi:hypothetical protein